MDSVDRRRRNRQRTPSIEGLEDRHLLTTATADLAMVSATTADSRGVTFTYDVSDAAVDRPVHFEVYRSADNQFDPGDLPIGSLQVVPPGPGQGDGTPDQAGQPATAVGHHQITLPLPDGLSTNPKHPFVIVVADPENANPEVDRAQNAASFRKYTIAVVTHGGVQPKSWKHGPPWELRMAAQLEADGYDAVIPYNWVAASNHAGSAVPQAPKVAALVLQAASQFPANDPVDVHFIGHSEGAVVNSQAILELNQAGWTPALRAGYLKVTMLDPHAANNALPQQQYSVSNGLLGWIARQEINAFQSKAKDPPVVVPPNVQDAEVFYQHTPVKETYTSNNGIYNLWGQVPVQGQANYFDLTASGISHSGSFGVQDWYRLNVAPTLGDGAPRVQSAALTATKVPGGPSTVSAILAAHEAEYTGKASPGALVRVFAVRAGESTLTQVGRTVAGSDGTWDLTTRPLALGRYRVTAVSNVTHGLSPARRGTYIRPTAFLPRLTIAPGQATT